MLIEPIRFKEILIFIIIKIIIVITIVIVIVIIIIIIIIIINIIIIHFTKPWLFPIWSSKIYLFKVFRSKIYTDVYRRTSLVLIPDCIHEYVSAMLLRICVRGN